MYFQRISVWAQGYVSILILSAEPLLILHGGTCQTDLFEEPRLCALIPSETFGQETARKGLKLNQVQHLTTCSCWSLQKKGAYKLLDRVLGNSDGKGSLKLVTYFR